MTSDRYALCPHCGESILFRMYGEWQGVPPWTGWVESLDETVQECSCPLTEKQLDRLFDESEEAYDCDI